MQHSVSLTDYMLVDLILGKQCDAILFDLYPTELQQALFNYVQKRRSRLIISGSFVASSEKSNLFMKKGLRYTLGKDFASKNGLLFAPEQHSLFSLQTWPNAKQYFVQNMQSPSGVDRNAKVILKYNDTELPAAIVVGRKSKIVVAGFPFESVIGDESRRYLMKLFIEE